jgi:DNA transposition AAA+ family ATPase
MTTDHPTTPTTDLIRLDSYHPAVARLIEIQASESDQTLARRRLSCSPSTWSRIRSGDYHAGDHQRMAEKLAGSLAALEDALAAGAATHAAAGVVPCAFLRAGLAGVRRSFGHPRNRLVVALAPTGGGKTTLGRQIADTYHGRVLSIEATETWRSSYLKACLDILTAAGAREMPASAARAEGALLRELQARPRILVIDEAHYFGSTTINLVKAILNQTPCSVVLLAIPALWRRMSRTAWEEAEQLRTRCCAMVSGDTVHARDVATYLESRIPAAWAALDTEPRAAIAAAIVGRANSFGLWSTVEAIASELRDDTAGGAPLALETVTAAVRALPAAARH